MSESECFPDAVEDGDEQLSVGEQTQATEVIGGEVPTTSQHARRSQRVRKLTEKGQKLHEEQIRKIANRCSVCYEMWKTIAKDAKQAIDGQCSKDLLQIHVNKVTKASINLNCVYE